MASCNATGPYLGYITPEVTGKLPGLASPSTGLKGADTPYRPAAIAVVPAPGAGRIVAYCPLCNKTLV